ncbi:murein hydrolase activator EnvC family protein [Novosphingobium lentum]|uniref:murein hydrolase activator EnvC family protein n=1 Tax=Novosphingobium lentum TaxID=145287 RepID=UPI0008341C36|nr:peptidoglycan DD-metalloendopeptidase family protein [Novosphingobium lentum]
MTSRHLFLALLVAVPALAGWSLAAQDAPFQSAGEANDALHQAQVELTAARTRGERLEAEAQGATAAADRTARQAAAVAARIQQAEAQIAVNQAQIALVDRQRDSLRLRIAQRQEPLVQLTGALQLMSRRPLALSLLRPGSLRDTVYLRAVLETMLPEVRRRTAGLRDEIARGRQLQQRAAAGAADLRASEAQLGERRTELARVESRQRQASLAAQGSANREGDRALALAEQARDLRQLMGQLEDDGALRQQLATLPGPVLRPARPEQAAVVDDSASATPAASLDYILPVAGRLVAGFGEGGSAGPSTGISLAPASGAQVVVPAAGRVVFAGPYRGYGRIVIVEHPGGWTSLVTNLALVTAHVGDEVVQGAPLGTAGPGRPVVTVELRKEGTPVNPMELLRG